MAETTAPDDILILGASYAGASTAHYLFRHVLPALPKTASVRVTLVSASAEMLCRPACPRAMLSDKEFDQRKLFVGVPASFEQYPQEKFRFVHGSVLRVDHAQRRVAVRVAEEESVLPFHALVIATGATTPSPLHSLAPDGAELRTYWETLRAALPGLKKVVVAGGGPTGVETAGELGEYLNGKASWWSDRLEDPKVDITLVTAGAQLLTALRPVIAAEAEKLLAQRGVTVLKNVRVQAVEPESAGTAPNAVVSNTTVTLSDGRTLTADLYIPATGSKPNTAFLDSSLLTPSGHVNTNAKTLRIDAAGERIYAIGDVASTARPAVHLILSAIPVVCANIKSDLLRAYTGQKLADREWKEDTRETQLVPIGKHTGVGAAMGWRLPGFLVWLIKGRDYWLSSTGGLWSGKHWAKES